MSELIEKLKANGELEKFYKKCTGGEATIGAITKDIIEESGNHACFAGMQYRPYDYDRGDYTSEKMIGIDCEYVILCTKRIGNQNPDYLKFLVEESCFSNLFINDVKSIIKDKVAIVRADVPGNILFYALHLIRHYWEYPGRPQNFDKLVETGMEPKIAFWVAQYLKLVDGKFIGSSYTHTAGQYGVDLDRAMKGEFKYKRNSNYNVDSQYAGIDKTFGDSGYDQYGLNGYNLNKIILDINTKKNAKTTKSQNPFAQKPMVSNSCPIKDFVDNFPLKVD